MTTEETLVGPLTATEWASFALGDDDRNPLPPCCGNLSDVRDAIFDTMRAGGDPDLYWRSIASVWHLVEDHDSGEPDGVLSHPTMRKLFDAYVAGRKRPEPDEGFAHLLAVKPDYAQEIIATIPESWDTSTREARMRALARIGGRFVGYVLDPAEREKLSFQLAGELGMPNRDVQLVIDALRLANGLPYEATSGRLRRAELEEATAR